MARSTMSQAERESIIQSLLAELGNPSWCKSIGVGYDFMEPCISVMITEDVEAGVIPESWQGIQVKIYKVDPDSDMGM